MSGTLILEISEPPVVFDANECDLEAVEDLFSSDPDLNFRSELNPRSDPGLRLILKLFLLDNFRKLLFVFPMMNNHKLFEFDFQIIFLVKLMCVCFQS